MDLKDLDGPTGIWGDDKAEAILRFQARNGLKQDAVIQPGGETIRKLQANLAAKPVKAEASKNLLGGSGIEGDRSSPQLAQAGVSSTKPPSATVRPRQTPTLASPVPNLQIRGRDSRGEGRFGASRDGGKRKHEGVDVEANSGSTATSTVHGTITRIGKPYEKEPFRYVEVTTSDGFVVRHFYVLPNQNIRVGSLVKAGQTPIGTVQDLSIKFPGITNHIHIVMRDSKTPNKSGKSGFKGFKLIDPTPHFGSKGGP